MTMSWNVRLSACVLSDVARGRASLCNLLFFIILKMRYKYIPKKIAFLGTINAQKFVCIFVYANKSYYLLFVIKKENNPLMVNCCA